MNMKFYERYSATTHVGDDRNNIKSYISNQAVITLAIKVMIT
jgi:hypothetical protein